MTSFWGSEEWFEYERATGQEPGTRKRLLSTAPWKTRVVDLQRPLEVLHAEVRSSYRHLVNKWTKTPSQQVHLFTGGDVASTGHWMSPTERCHRLHVFAAGRETRPQASWDVQDAWERCGIGVVALGVRLGPQDGGFQDLGFAYAVRTNSWAYYFSAASIEKNVNHALQWHLMMRLRDLGVRWYELGWQGQAETEKEKSIEFFRSGWGGVDIPVGGQQYVE